LLIFRRRRIHITYKLPILDFWDKENNKETLVLATHGIIKKTGKTPEREIEKAEQLRLKYFELKKARNANKK